MEELKRFQVYGVRTDGSYWHVTSMMASCLREALAINRKTGTCTKYRVTGVTLDTGQPYDDRDFPYHIYKRIENKGKRIKNNGYFKK